MKMRDKIEAVMRVQPYRDEIISKLEEIIKNTYDYFLSDVRDFTIADGIITADYNYACRGEYDMASAGVPVEWLDEGFDYESAYREQVRKAEEKRREAELEQKRKEAAAKKAAAEQRAKKEYETYLRLKNKYEGSTK